MPRAPSKYERAWRERKGHARPVSAEPKPDPVDDAELERLTAPKPAPIAPTKKK